MVTQGPRMRAYTRKTFCLSRPCLWVFFFRALYLGFKEDSFTWFSLAVDCVMVELKLSWFNTVFLKTLLPFKYKLFQVLGRPRESWSDVFTRTLLTGMSRSSSVRIALLNTYSISLQQSREENSGGQSLTLRCLPKSVLRLCERAALEYWGFDHFLSL